MTSETVEIILRWKNDGKPETGDLEKIPPAAKQAQSSLTELASGYYLATEAAQVLGRAVLDLMERFAGFVDAVGDMSTRTGLAAETLIGLQFAAEASGGTISEVEMALVGLTGKMGEAAKGNEQAVAAFDRLGISVVDAGGHLRSADEVLREVADGLAGIGNPTERAAAAVDLLGTRGTTLVTVLGEGAGALDEWTRRAEDAGVTMGGETVAAADAFQESMAELNAAVTGLVNTLGTEFGPQVVESINDLSTLVQTTKDLTEPLKEVHELLSGPLNPASWILHMVNALVEALGYWRELEAKTEAAGASVADDGAFGLNPTGGGPVRAGKVHFDSGDHGISFSEPKTGTTGGADDTAKRITAEAEALARVQDLLAAARSLDVNALDLDVAAALTELGYQFEEVSGLVGEGGLTSTLEALGDGVQEVIDSATKQADAQRDAADAGDALADEMRGVVVGLSALGRASAAVDIANGGPQAAMSALSSSGATGSLIAGIIDLVGNLGSVGDAFNDFTMNVFDSIANIGQTLGDNIQRWLETGTESVLKSIPGLVMGLLENLDDILIGLIDGIANVLVMAVTEIPAMLHDIAGMLMSIEFWADLVSAIVSALWEAITGIITGVGESFGQAVEHVVRGAGELWNDWLVPAGQAIGQWVQEFVSFDWVDELLASVSDFFDSLLGKDGEDGGVFNKGGFFDQVFVGKEEKAAGETSVVSEWFSEGYDNGGYVNKTGLAMVHAGEVYTRKEDVGASTSPLFGGTTINVQGFGIGTMDQLAREITRHARGRGLSFGS